MAPADAAKLSGRLILYYYNEIPRNVNCRLFFAPPFRFPRECGILMAGFVQGVQYSNPDAKCYGVVTGTYEDPAKGKESALALIDMGCDIIYQSADSTGVGAIEACLDKKVKIIGYGGDQYEMAPDLVMTCFVTDNKNVIIKQAELIETGKFGGLWEPGVAEGVCYITPYHNFEDKIPQKVKDMEAHWFWCTD